MVTVLEYYGKDCFRARYNSKEIMLANINNPDIADGDLMVVGSDMFYNIYEKRNGTAIFLVNVVDLNEPIVPLDKVLEDICSDDGMVRKAAEAYHQLYYVEPGSTITKSSNALTYVKIAIAIATFLVFVILVLCTPL